MDRLYKDLPQSNSEEIKRILSEGTIEEVMILPLSIGMYHDNLKEAQDICVRLAYHDDERVRANAALGLSYIARKKRGLEKHIIKPVLHKLLNDCNEYKWKIVDSINDINFFMKWSIAEKALKRIDENK